MVSKRQKLARKQFKEANPELFPAPEPKPPADPSKKKNKRKEYLNKVKRKKEKNYDPSNPVKKKRFGKHPLRVAGMKPGESCFICKANDHIAKHCPKKAEWEKHKICLSCRQRGHSLKNCPNKNDEISDSKLCYNCGETGHSLANCPRPLEDGGTKFAKCFICNEQGHLSKICPKNPHGIYPKGGSCKICGGVTHLAKDCPDKGKNASAGVGNGYTGMKFDSRPTGKVTKLMSGDDLDDDFVKEDSAASGSKSAKPKTKGTKVVNFAG